jgi:uncharacterized lipoprotein
MHATLRAALPLDACFVCYHDNADACDCRKPQPGMLLQAAAAHGSIWPKASWSATAGATSTPAPPRVAAPSGSTAATASARPSIAVPMRACDSTLRAAAEFSEEAKWIVTRG